MVYESLWQSESSGCASDQRRHIGHAEAHVDFAFQLQGIAIDTQGDRVDEGRFDEAHLDLVGVVVGPGASTRGVRVARVNEVAALREGRDALNPRVSPDAEV